MTKGQPDCEDGERSKADKSCLRVDASVLIGDDAGYKAANRGETGADLSLVGSY